LTPLVAGNRETLRGEKLLIFPGRTLMRLVSVLRVLPLAASLVLVPAAYGQDVYVEAISHTDESEMMGQKTPAKDGLVKTWIGEKRIATWNEAENTGVIVRGDINKMFILFPKNKTYYESPLPFKFPPEIEKMQEMMKVEATVTPTGEKKVIAGFNTERVEVTISMMGQDMKMNYWISKEVPVSTDQLAAVIEAMFSRNPMFGDLLDKFRHLEGYPVRVEFQFLGMNSYQEVTKVEQKPAPAGTYEVPEGFTKTEEFQMS